LESRYQGILGACVGLGNVIGPFLAAALTNSWRWEGLFWIVSILAFASGLIILIVVPQSQVTGNTTAKYKVIDWWGILSSSAGLILLLIPISSGGAVFAWNSPISISMLTLGSISILIFILVEWKWAKMPLFPLKFFRNPPVCAIMIQNLLMGIVYYSNLYFLPVYYQSARRWSLMQAAILTIPFVASQSIVSVVSGQYISHFKRYGEVIWCGYAFWALGSGLTLLFDDTTHPWVIVLVLMVGGSGVGMVFQPTLVAMQAHTATEDRAVITSVRNFSRSIGGALGLALSTAIFSNKVSSTISSLPSKVKTPIMNAIMSVPSLKSTTAMEREVILKAYVDASRSVFMLWVILQGVCLILCVLIKDRGLKRPEETSKTEMKEPEVVETDGHDVESYTIARKLPEQKLTVSVHDNSS
jgi:MFS family permease